MWLGLITMLVTLQTEIQPDDLLNSQTLLWIAILWNLFFLETDFFFIASNIQGMILIRTPLRAFSKFEPNLLAIMNR